MPDEKVNHELRIRRTRRKGYRLPRGAKCVHRPTKWGNPFRTAEEFRDWLENGGPPQNNITHAELHNRRLRILREIGELRGKLLACWCPLTRACHADVLAELANDE